MKARQGFTLPAERQWRVRRTAAAKAGNVEEYIGYALLMSMWQKIAQFSTFSHGQVAATHDVAPYNTAMARSTIRQETEDGIKRYGSLAKAVLALKGFNMDQLPEDGVVGLFKSCDFSVYKGRDKTELKVNPFLPYSVDYFAHDLLHHQSTLLMSVMHLKKLFRP
jgi:hypothetical protein